MSFFAASVLHKFLIFVFLLGLLSARASSVKLNAVVIQSALGIVIGFLMSLYMPTSLLARVSVSLLEACVLAAMVLTLLLPKVLSMLCGLWQVVLLALAGFTFFSQPYLSLITNASVLNTELILNCAALIFGVGILVSCQLCSYRMAKLHSTLAFTFGLLILLVLGMASSGELLLAMMKLHVVDLTKLRLSYASKTINFTDLLSYIPIAFMLLFSLYYRFKFVAPLRTPLKDLQGIAYRQALARYYQQRRLLRLTLCTLIIAVVSLLYWDLVASKPATLSASTVVELGSDNEIHLNIKDLNLGNGKLYRFAWVASDGKVIRFFVINRYKDRVKLGVVFDACLLCGDAGYIQSGNQVICLACGVHIFIPSIGKAGGCNPIPMTFSQDATEVRISRASLMKGYQYFSQIMEIEVIDPVSKATLLNTKASSQFKYQDKTWFFANDDNYERFRADPSKYIEHVSNNAGDK